MKASELPEIKERGRHGLKFPSHRDPTRIHNKGREKSSSEYVAYLTLRNLNAGGEEKVRKYSE